MVEGVDQVYESPKGRFDANKLNNNLVKCRVALQDGEFKIEQTKCSSKFATKLAAANDVVAKVKKILGAAAIEAAELRMEQSSVAGAAGAGSS